MLKFDVKRKINTLRDILVGKVPDPKAQVEQITIAMIYKFMDDMDIEAIEFGGERVFFKEEYEKYAWSELMSSENSGQQRAYIYSEGIEKMSMNPYIPQLFRDIFRGTYIPYRDPETLNMFLKEISEFSYDNSEDLGNAFEYLLSIMSSQGDAGQFRTPRHIIDMMVEIVDPKKNDTILDPACGTAGFLISAYKHILDANIDENGKSTLTPDDRKRMAENFAGYDISPDMVRLSRVNMYLHRFTKPQISEYDTLTSEEKWDENYDIIFANPPFMTPKGGIMPHNRYMVKARRAEVLFVDYIAEHLNPTGKAAIIVPEGIVFQSSNAYKELRRFLVEEGLLYAVVSLPAGIFNPYSGVKTSILFIDKTLAKQRDEILFVKMNHDGFDLGAQRREIKKNDIPDIINIFKAYQKGEQINNNTLVALVKKTTIANKEYILVGNRYKASAEFNSKWPLMKIGEVCEIERGASPRPINDYITDDAHGINWIKIGDGKSQSLFIDSTKEKITEEGAKKSRSVKKGDLILSNSMSYGRPYILNIDGCVHDGWLIIRNKKGLFNPVYLCYILGSNEIMKEYKRLATGGVVNNHNSDLVRSCKIPVPSLSVQNDIVEEIEQYQKIIDGAKQVVNAYKPTIKINSNWEMGCLHEYCNFVRGPFGGSLKKEIFVDDGYLVYEQYHAINNDFNFGRYFITEQKFEEMKRFEVFANDILISCSGTMGKIAIVPETHRRGIINQALLKLTPKDAVLPMFVKLYLESSEIQKRYFTNQSGAAIQNVVSVKELKEIPFPNISIDEQRTIVEQVTVEMNKIKECEDLIKIFEKKITDKISEVWGD